jgi:hypothetical protein
MSDRATVFEGVQIGVEAIGTPGVAVPAVKRLLGCEIVPTITTEPNEFGPIGYKYQTIVVNGKEWTVGALAGVGAYVDLAYLLSNMFGDATITSLGSGAYQWVWNPKSTAADRQRTFTMERGSEIRAERFAGAIGNTMGMTYNRGSVAVEGEVLGKLTTDGVYMAGNEVVLLTMTGSPTGGTFKLTYSAQETAATIPYNATASQVQTALESLAAIGGGNVYVSGGPLPAAPIVVTFVGTLGRTDVTPITVTTPALTGGTTPALTPTVANVGSAITELSLVPIVPNEVNITLDVSAAALGTTQLLRALEAAWNVSGKQGMIWALNRSDTSYAASIEKKPDATASLVLGADPVGMGLLTPMRAGATRFLRIDSLSPTMAGGAFPYRFQADMAVKILNPGQKGEEDGLLTQPWDFRIVHDPTWGQAMKFTLVTSIASL